MAARRLLILMLVVLAVSTFGAALIAPRPERGSGTATTTTQRDRSPMPARDAPGLLIEARVQTGTPRAETIHLQPGDQLELTVRSRTAGQVEIPRFGLLEDVGHNQAARFSLLLGEPSSFEVRLAGSGRTVAHVEVAPERGEQRRSPQGGDGAAS